MRTAITLGKKDKDWIILSGPDVPADQQRTSFSNIGLKWPKDVDEVRFQMNDGAAKTKNKAKAECAVENIKSATARADKKAEIAKQNEIKVKEDAEKKAEESAKQAEAARQSGLKAKEDSKRSTHSK